VVGVQVVGNGASAAGEGIRYNSATRPRVNNCHVLNFGSGVGLDDNGSAATRGHSSDNEVHDNGTNITLSAANNHSTADNHAY
jgi:hypothetical protein